MENDPIDEDAIIRMVVMYELRPGTLFPEEIVTWYRGPISEELDPFVVETIYPQSRVCIYKKGI